MTGFRYKAVGTDGRAVTGHLDLASMADVTHTLSAQGLFVTDVAAEIPSSTMTIDRRQVLSVLQTLAALTEVGVPLHKALEASATLVSPGLGAVVDRVRRRVQEGSSLAKAMLAEPRSFSPVIVGLVTAGERGIGLDTALAEAARQAERELEMRDRIRAALTYPVLLATVGSISVLLVLFLIIPRFSVLIEDIGGAPPMLAAMLLAFSRIAGEHAVALGATTLGLVALIGTVVTRRPAWFQELALTIPVFGPIRHGFATARICRILSGLFGSGTSALPALDIVTESVSNGPLSRRLAAARRDVAEGAPLATAVRNSGALTPGATRLMAIGEAAGRLSPLLGKAADLEQRAAQERLDRVVVLVEPIMIIGFAAIVALVAAGLLQAVYSVRPGLP